MANHYILSLILFLTVTLGFGQNTIGTTLNTADAYDGYTLFTVDKSTYLINNCGQVVHEWTSDYLYGKSVYILPNGDLLRGEEIQNEDVPIPGIGGRLAIRNWENELLWSYTFSTDVMTSHHDVYPLPNGNILVLLIEKRSREDAIQAGRDPEQLIEDFLYDEKIIEIEPIGTNEINIVWEWSFWDHLVQDFDDTRDNYGDVLTNPQLLDINYMGVSNAKMNWLHVNSIQYNASLDQIIISSRHMGEFYMIDHSTTKEEAAGHTGGLRGKGGDFLYRWGNPQAYKAGDPVDQKLYGQHFPHWIPEGYREGGKVILFNNGFNRTPDFSSVHTISTAINEDGSYTVPSGKRFGPEDFDWTYQDPVDAELFYSRILSSAQRLPNGNTLICEGTKGKFFELDSEDNIVWTYIQPIGNNGPLAQGATPAVKSIFRAEKYPTDYPAFRNRDMTPGDPIELDFNLDLCKVLSTPEFENAKELTIPNPVTDRLVLATDLNVEKIEVYNVQGQKILVAFQEKSVNFTSIPSGIYFVKIYTDRGLVSRKIIKS